MGYIQQLFSIVKHKKIPFDKPKHEKVYTMRMRGATFEQIGAEINVTKQRAHQMYRAYLKKHPNKFYRKEV